MSWVVDTSVLLDIHSADAAFGRASAECLAKYCAEALVISPVTYVELAPAFDGDAHLQEQFLAEVGVESPTLWTLRDTQAAYDLWAVHIRKKHVWRRSGGRSPMRRAFLGLFRLVDREGQGSGLGKFVRRP